MNILYIGCFHKDSSDTYAAKAFEQNGCKVYRYNYLQFGTWQLWHPLSHIETEISYILEHNPVDLIFIQKGEHLRPEFLAEIKKRADTWYWFTDPKREFIRMGGDRLARECTYRSFTNSILALEFDGYHIFEGYDPEIWHSENVEKKYDVLFAGSIDTNRKLFLKSNPKIKVVNNVPYAELNTLYNQSRVVLNFTRNDSIISDRVIQVLATDTVLLTQFAEDLFKLHNWDGWKRFVFVTPKDMNAKIGYVLGLYEKYKELKQTFPIERFTWKEQMRKVLSYV